MVKARAFCDTSGCMHPRPTPRKSRLLGRERAAPEMREFDPLQRHLADLYRNVSERRIDTKHWICAVLWTQTGYLQAF